MDENGEATSYAYGVAVYGTGPAYISGYNQASVDGEPYVGSSTFRRRLASPETTLDSTTRQAPSTIQDLECSAFSASDTAHASNAQADYSCQFKACPGDRVRLSMRPADGGSCSGYPVLRLIEGAGYPSDSEVLTVELAGAFADGSCPVLVYDFRDLPQCQHFTVVQGCEESSSCSGQATIHYYVSP
eukprot:gene25516-30806_t